MTLYLQKSISQDSVFQPSENLYDENFSSSPTMVGPVVHFGYKRMSSKRSVNSDSKLKGAVKRNFFIA